MLVRYSASEKGTPRKRAEVYTVKEHKIRRRDIDPDAVRIAQRLKSAGHSAYVVGGAVRDLLIGRVPKDFDLVTDAPPRKIKRLFRNSRIIGKRFRLVHVYFKEKIIELSTFRSLDQQDEETVYGTIQEDVLRRDFTLNALYYCPVEEIIIDYIGGVKDIRNKKVRPLIPLKTIFTEDPVRMIRGVKYSAALGFDIPLLTRMRMRRQASLLAGCSTSRLTEEMFKILGGGYSAPILRALFDYGLLRYLVPALAERLSKNERRYLDRFFASLRELDATVGVSPERHRLVSAVVKDYVLDLSEEGRQEKLLFKDYYHAVKQFMLPLVPSNKDVDTTITELFRKKKARTRRPRRPHHPHPAAQPAP